MVPRSFEILHRVPGKVLEFSKSHNHLLFKLLRRWVRMGESYSIGREESSNKQSLGEGNGNPV